MSQQYIIIIVAIVVMAYMVVRQLQARKIQFPQIFIMPALLVWYTYTNITTEVAKDHASVLLLLALFGAGLLPGLVLGGFRSLLYHLRIDKARGIVLAQRAGVVSIAIWIVLLILKIGATLLTYTTPASMVVTIVLVTTPIHGLFIGNLLAESVGLWLRATAFQQKQVPLQVTKY